MFLYVRWMEVIMSETVDRQRAWLLDSSSRYFGIFDVNFVRSRLCLLIGSTPNDAFIDNKLFIGGLYKIKIVFG